MDGPEISRHSPSAVVDWACLENKIRIELCTYAQARDIYFAADGTAKNGLLVRHLVMLGPETDRQDREVRCDQHREELPQHPTYGTVSPGC